MKQFLLLVACVACVASSVGHAKEKTAIWGIVASDIADYADYANYYGDRQSVDDGFGGVWNVYKGEKPRGVWGTFYAVWRPTNEQGKDVMVGEYYDRRVDLLSLRYGSLPPEAALDLAFYGYRTGMKKIHNDAFMKIHLWVDPQTGCVNEVGYMFNYDSLPYGMVLPAIPPRNYAMYEDIVKKMVRFDIAEVREADTDMKTDIVYQFWVRFSEFGTVEGEPDFLQTKPL